MLVDVFNFVFFFFFFFSSRRRHTRWPRDWSSDVCSSDLPMSNYDEIRLIGIGGYGYHGVLASEREGGQPFHAGLVLPLDTEQAAATHEPGHTPAHSAVARAGGEGIGGEPGNPLDTLAARLTH